LDVRRARRLEKRFNEVIAITLDGEDVLFTRQVDLIDGRIELRRNDRLEELLGHG